jgi:hypothetical protein
MPTISRKPDPGAVQGASPDPGVNAAPALKPEAKRWFSLRGGERGKQFALSLKANARWMKRFLHGGL